MLVVQWRMLCSKNGSRGHGVLEFGIREFLSQWGISFQKNFGFIFSDKHKYDS